MPAALTVRERTPKKSSSSRGRAEGRVTFQPVGGDRDNDADAEGDALFEGRDTDQPSDIFDSIIQTKKKKSCFERVLFRLQRNAEGEARTEERGR